MAASGQGDAAQDEFRIEPVPALLQVTAIRHLRNHVGRAQQVTHLDVARVGDLDLCERDFVTGEMNDLGGDRYRVREPDHRQVFLQEARAP